MQSLDEHVTIPADTSSGNDLDFDFLREMGQQYIEKLGRRIWTDYNIHDPGITILELLCYAITDLGLRLDMDIRDILASKEDNFRQMHEQFASAARILTCKPVTSSDYRKLFIDLDGVKNAWLRPFRLPLQLDCDPERPVLRYEPLIGNTKKTMQIDIRGLYSILVDFDEHADEPAVIRNIETLYHQNRNLCEDLAEVRRVPLHCIRVCGAIQLEPGVDEELVHAQILWAIRNYFSPDILPLSLSEMQAKGFAPDEIFNGPVLQHGFISDEDLQNSELRTEVRLSDIIRLIMSVDGVKVIEDISIDNGPAADASKSDGCCGDLSILQTSPWMICIQPGHKPYLSDRSNFTYKKVYLPVGINKSKVDAYILGFERELQNRLDRVYEDLAIPLGEYRDIGAYSTIQHDLPETYGISPSGLPSSVSEERKARAKQLKGYLLFYDQVMAQYFSHLEHVKQLLAADEKLKRIYFFKAVDDIRGIEELAGDPSLYEQNVSRILHDPANPADFTGPRERLLDHLLSRFAEVFSDYSSVMYKLFGPLVEADILLTKNRFLEKYDTLSSERGLAFNYTLDHSWNTGNVTGFEKRLAFLAGIRDYNRRNLYSHKLFIETIPKLEDGINFNEYRWVIKDDTTTYLSSRNDFRLEQEAIDDLLHSLKISSDEENFHLHQTSGGLYYVVLAEPAYRDNPDYRHVIGRQYNHYFALRTKAETRLNLSRQFLRDLQNDEGFYVIENILLLPFKKLPKPDDCLPLCISYNCETCGPADPFSFRVVIVFPGWTTRFSNADFRKFMEELIHRELPAHILARVCWVGYIHGVVDDPDNDMRNLQEKWKAFLGEKKEPPDYTASMECTKELFNVMNQLNNIYPKGTLHDCENETTEENKNKIILNRTALGTL